MKDHGALRVVAAAVLLVATAAGDGGEKVEPCDTCARADVVESQVRLLEEHLKGARAVLGRRRDALQENAAWLEGLLASRTSQELPSTEETIVGADGGARPGRRLSSGGTAIAVETPFMHAFAPDHTCPGGVNHSKRMLLPLVNGTPSWSPAPVSPDANLSVVAVGKRVCQGGTCRPNVTEIQRFPPPLTVLHGHGPNCSDVPTLALGLHTSVPALVVGGQDVGAALAEFEARAHALNPPPTLPPQSPPPAEPPQTPPQPPAPPASPPPPLATTTSYTGCNDWNGQHIQYLDRHNPQCTYPAAMQRWRGANHGCGGNGEIEYVCTTPVYYGSESAHSTGCTAYGALHYLDRHTVDCGTDKVLTRWYLANCGGSYRMDYTCMEASIVSTSDHYTGCNYVANAGLEFLDRHTIDCGSGRALQKWHLAGYGCGGDDRQIYYRCAELGHWPAEAGYACEDDYVYGGNQLQTITSVTTLEDCQAACTARMDCAALIHNNLNQCYLLSEQGTVTADDPVYETVSCLKAYPPPPPPPAYVTTAAFVMENAGVAGYCLHPSASYPSQGALLEHWAACDATVYPGIKFRAYDYDHTDGSFLLQSADPSYCCDPSFCVHPQATIAQGVKLLMWDDCSVDEARLRFTVIDVGGGAFMLRSALYPSYCVHPQGGDSFSNGDNVVWYPDCDTSRPALSWKFNFV